MSKYTAFSCISPPWCPDPDTNRWIRNWGWNWNIITVDVQLKWLVRQTCCCNTGNTGGSGRKISRDLTVNIDHVWSADVNEVYCKQRPFLSNRPTSSTKTRLTGPRFVTQHTINMGCLKHAPSPDKPPTKPRGPPGDYRPTDLSQNSLTDRQFGLHGTLARGHCSG